MKIAMKALFLFVMFLATITVVAALLPSCAGTPHTIGQLEGMTDEQYADWHDTTLVPWAESAGLIAVTNELATVEQVHQFTNKLREAALLDTIPASVIVDVAKSIGWKDRKAVLTTVSIGHALLAARGGFKVLGPRSKEVLLAIADAVDAGASGNASPATLEALKPAP